MTHWIETTLEAGGYQSARATCDAPEGAPCRLACERQPCREEGWGPVLHDEAGPYHEYTAFPDAFDTGDIIVRHDMVDQGECLWVTWANEDPGLLLELGEGPGKVVGLAAVKPVWHGIDEGVGFEPYVDDGHVRVTFSDFGVEIICDRDECKVDSFHWMKEVEQTPGTGRAYLHPSDITRAWYAHLATHYQG